MNEIKVNLEFCKNFINEDEYESIFNKVKSALVLLESKQGKGNDFLGWMDLPVNLKKEFLEDIAETAEKIRNQSEVLVVIGIGGSYLGSKAVIDALKGYFNTQGMEILFMGNSISSTYISEMTEYLKDKDFSVNVISKSGTTTEPAIAFRVITKLLDEKYGEKSSERIYVTTDATSGALRKIAIEKNYKSFVISDDIGGRYSVLTAVGLLPIAAAGYDIFKLVEGAKNAYHHCNDNCIAYVSARNILYSKGKKIEIMANYEPKLHFFTEWWKQLFGESEGKELKGIFPAGVDLTADLHSMGQYIQEGERILFETVLNVLTPNADVLIPSLPDDVDGLRYIEGKSVNYVNQKALEGTIQAHTDGSVPNIVIEIPVIDEFNLGYLIYFFEKSCGISGHVLGVNPFNQPGVEMYKKNMFKLLGKPGF
ncbi:MAG: glucose-6-phosphate isomerase [Clostridia bacterium]|nr:glucose-6-phosphate isomerase [Clostridia bacterium]